MVIACLDEGSNPSGSTYKATFWVAFFVTPPGFEGQRGELGRL